MVLVSFDWWFVWSKWRRSGRDGDGARGLGSGDPDRPRHRTNGGGAPEHWASVRGGGERGGGGEQRGGGGEQRGAGAGDAGDSAVGA